MREVDFYLIKDNHFYRCEVKLMGKGNPESADAVIARDSDLFVADKLSDLNKNQLDSRNVQWVELRNEAGYKRFCNVLDTFNISYNAVIPNLDNKINFVLNDLFPLS